MGYWGQTNDNANKPSIAKSIPKIKKNVGIQTIIPSRLYIPPAMLATHKLQVKDYPKFLYTSHTIFFMLAFAILYIYVAEKMTSEDQIQNTKTYISYKGNIWFMCSAYIFCSCSFS